MKKSFLILLVFLAMINITSAQDDLLSELSKDDAAKVKEDITIATFKSTRIINMHSIEMTGSGNLQFMVIHHFGSIWDQNEKANNLARVFGFNGNFASTYVSFDYSTSHWLNIGTGLAGNGIIEPFVKLKLLRQQTGLRNYPISVAYMTTANVNASRSIQSPNDFLWNRFSYLHQLLIARKFSDKFSLQLIPSMIHQNITSYGLGNQHNIYSLGLGGRLKLSNKRAITFEYSRQLNMYKNVIDRSGEIVNYSPNLISLGYDWDTGGHIFQFFISSSSFASNLNQLTINPEKNKLGLYSLGFNLNRSYSIKNKVKE